MAIKLNAYAWREIEMAERLAGEKNPTGSRGIPYSITLRIIEVTRT